MEIGKRLGALMKERGLSQYRLAKQSGFTQAYISSIIRGDRQPPIETLKTLCKSLGITIIEYGSQMVVNKKGPRPRFHARTGGQEQEASADEGRRRYNL